MLSVKHLRKAFGEQVILKALNLEIVAGSMTAIIGPNGCGKSTLFNLITGELTPDSGDIQFEHQSILGLKPRQIAEKGILRKFQIPGIYPSMSVAEHLRLPFVIQKQPVDNSLVQQTAEQMGLSTLMEQPAKILATGQKQWLEMAMLVLLKPRLLLLDEPISGMTAAEAAETQIILKRLNNDGLTIITIEHNIDFVRELTQDIAVIMNGEIIMRSDYDTIAQDADIRRHYLGSLYA